MTSNVEKVSIWWRHHGSLRVQSTFSISRSLIYNDDGDDDDDDDDDDDPCKNALTGPEELNRADAPPPAEIQRPILRPEP